MNYAVPSSFLSFSASVGHGLGPLTCCPVTDLEEGPAGTQWTEGQKRR